MSMGIELGIVSKTCKYIKFSYSFISHYNSEGKIVYNIASLGIVHNINDNTQKFYGGKQVTMT